MAALAPETSSGESSPVPRRVEVGAAGGPKPGDTMPFQSLPKGDTTISLPAETDAAPICVEKVLLVSEKLTGSEASGYSRDLAAALIRRGIRVAVLAPSASDPDRLAAMGCETMFASRCLWGRWAVFCFRAAREFARRFSPQLIHAQSAFAMALARPLAEDLGVPCVATCHQILKPGRISFPPLCTRLIAVSQVIRENLVNDIKIPKDRIRLIPIGIDVSRFKRHATREGGDTVVAAVGSLTKRKAFEYFVEAAYILADSGIEAKFLLAGEGPEERRLRRLASRLGLDRRLTFYTHPIDSAAVLAEADLVVHPSLQEGSGIGVLQALAAGVPVVAAGVGGVYDVLKDGETGYIVPAGNARAIAEKAGLLLKDGALRAKMGDAGRALVERDFTINRMAADTVDVYAEAIKEYASGR